MKKLSLNTEALHKGEVLTRSQLKRVLGGDGSSGWPGGSGGSGLCNPATTYEACYNCAISEMTDPLPDGDEGYIVLRILDEMCRRSFP